MLYIETLANLYSRVDNPFPLTHLSKDDSIAALEFFSERRPHSITADFLLRIQRESILQAPKIEQVDPIQWKLASIEEAISRREADLAISLLEDFTKCHVQLPDCLRTHVISLYFDAYREQGDHKSALRTFINAFKEADYLTSRLRVADFLQELSNSLPADVASSPDFLVARCVACSETVQDLYIALDDFLFAHDLSKPRDIFNIRDQFDTRIFAFVISQVMRRDVLSRGGYCASSRELDEERLFLLNSLGKITSGKTEFDFASEISTLNKELLVYAANRHVNAGRISINAEMIRDSAELIRASFIRYQALLEAESERNITLIPLSDLSLNENESPTETSHELRTKESLQVFAEMYFTILLDLCLFSEVCGLDATLSARIRHGSLNNMIRSPFEDGWLITRKSSNKKDYLPSKHWNDYLLEHSVIEEARDRVSAAIIRFTERLDAIVVHLQKRIIQIQVSNIDGFDILIPQYTGNPDGIFNYTELLFDTKKNEEFFGRAASSAEDLIDRILECFFTYTEDRLEDIRRFIANTTHDQIRECVDDLLEDVRAVGLPNRINFKFQDEIQKSKISLQNMIQSLCEWFKFKGISEFKDFPINVVFDSVLKAINDSSNGLLSAYCLEVPNIILKGDSFHALYDVFFTLLYNVVEHSDLSSSEIDLTIRGSMNEDILTFTLENNVNPEKDLNQSLETARSLIEKSAAGEASRITKEGKSGFFKIRKILERDLRRTQVTQNVNTIHTQRFSVSLGFETHGLISLNENTIN